jgi:hypothetical protein
MWTPALSGGGGGHGGDEASASTPSSDPGTESMMEGGDGGSSAELPYGRMFATFMLCCMCGSSMFSVLSK